MEHFCAAYTALPFSASPWARAGCAVSTANAAAIITTRNTLFTETSCRNTVMPASPHVEQAHHCRMRRIRAVDVAEHERAGLHDAVNNARIHCEVVDLEVLESVVHGERETAR